MCPLKSALQLFARLRLMQPEFIVRDHLCRTDEPDARLLLFNKNLASRELFAERNLSIRADDLDAGLAGYGFHFIKRVDFK